MPSSANLPLNRTPAPPVAGDPDRWRTLCDGWPEPLRTVLATGHVDRRPRFRDDRFDGLIESWTPPATVDAHHAAMARRALDEMERLVLAPAQPNRVLARVLALLSHFPGKPLAPEVEQMIALDWAEDLAEFPDWAVDRAARTWRRTQKWRPSIAEIRALCEDACAPERTLADRLQTIVRTGTPVNGGTGVRVLPLAAGSIRRMPGMHNGPSADAPR